MGIDIPAGIYPFFMSNSGAEKYDLKIGPDILDLVPHKYFNTAAILEDIKKYGFMCAFEPCAKHLKTCKLEEFLIVCDINEKYGEKFLLLFTEQSTKSYQNEIAEKEAAEEAKEAEAEAAIEENVTSPEEIIVQIKSEFIPNDYSSTTVTETINEINESNYKRDRPLIKLSVLRKNRHNNVNLKFGEYNQNESEMVNIMPKLVPEFEYQTSWQDFAVQVAPELSNSSTQTKQNRKSNKIIQCEYIKSPYDLNHFMKDSKVSNFLTRVLPDVERALQENETVDIFSDTLHFPPQDHDASYIGNEYKTEMKELRKCTNLEFSKGKDLSIIDWDSNKKDIVATSINDAASFDQRILSSCYDHQHFVIVWDLSEWVHSNIILKSITECRTFKFNFKSSKILVGGCMSGQVILWDLEKWNNRRIVRKYTKQIEINPVQNEPLKPSGVSHPEFSHHRSVSGLIWLPHNLQFNAKGKPLSEDHLSDISHQFITVSGDGQFLIWDTRFEEISCGKLPHIAKTKPSKANSRHMKKGTNNGGDDDNDEESSIPWLPLMRIKPKRPEGIRELSICKMIPLCRFNSIDGQQKIHSDFKIVMGSEEGHIMLVDLLPKSEKKDGTKETEDEQEAPEYIIWIALDNTRPCVSLSQSPFFPELIISISEHNFNLWNIDTKFKKPIFSSPDASHHLSDGAWSPVRPGLLFLSKIDGTIDIWDFTDSSYSPNSVITVTSGCITSLSFEVINNKSTFGSNKRGNKHRLAVGDSFGSLHILEVPEKFSKCLRNEKQMMQDFLKREISHYSEKFDTSQEEGEMSVNEYGEASSDVAGNATQNSNLDSEKSTKDENEEERMEMEYKELEKSVLSEFNIEVEQ